MTDFDYILLGGGAAGLSLALALTRSRLRENSIGVPSTLYLPTLGTF